MSEKDQDILARAKRRFNEAESFESDFRRAFREDIKFLYADSDNQDQWPPDVKSQRQLDKKPMITINKVHTHFLHIVNEFKENKPTVTVHPTSDAGTYEAAQIFEGIIRHIEYASDAQSAYDKAVEGLVGGGIGYIRLKTGYQDDQSFDQDLRIVEIANPLSVYLDPHGCRKKRDGSAAMWGFIFEDIPREEFTDKYPDSPISKGQDTTGDRWSTLDTVRVAEYYEVEVTREFMYAITSAQDGSVQYIRESDMSADMRKIASQGIKDGNPNMQRRKVDKRTVRWYLISGEDILDRNVWIGKYIPIIRCPGEEIYDDNGKLDRKGITRYMKDAQRTYNYNTSAALEYGALQSKTPWVASVEATEGLEKYWDSANVNNFSRLPYNGMDETGNPIAPPQRQDPPSSAPVYMDGIQIAQQELMMTSGQYEATFSQQGNEISGVAIDKRQSQGQRVTFHYIDSMSQSIRFLGKQLIDAIPKVYDTQRIVRIMGEDGDEQQIQIDPNAKQATQQTEEPEEAKVQTIFNPNVGTFDVVAAVGPNFETRRQEAFAAMKEILAASPELMQVIGDLWAGSADFPNAQKIQERLRNWIPPAILGTGPSQAEQQLTQQVQALQAQLTAATQALHDKSSDFQIRKQREDMEYVNHLALRMEEAKKDAIDAFKAETDRLKALAPAVDPLELEAIIRKMVAEIVTAKNPGQDLNPDTQDPDAAYLQAAPEVTAPLPVDPAAPPQTQNIPQPQQV